MKTKVGTEMTKEEEAYAPPVQTPQFVQPPHSAVMMPAQTILPGTTCWYVFGVLSTIFCCLPCGVIGLVHAMIARHEGERGNVQAHRRRLFQAKCWTSWSIALGVVFVILCIAWVAVGYYWDMGRWGMGGWYGEEYDYDTTPMYDSGKDWYKDDFHGRPEGPPTWAEPGKPMP